MPAAQPHGNRTRRGADRRKEILDVAREIFSEKGFERTSMAEIAAKVGVVEGALYKHFGGKRELLFEATRAFYEPLIAATTEELLGVRGAKNRLRFVIFRQLQAFVRHPEMCRLIIQDIRPHDDYYGSVVRELNKKSTSAVIGILEQARNDGELTADISLPLVRDVIFGGIEHMAWRALAGRGTLDVERQAEQLTQLIWNGLGPRDAEAGAPALQAQIDRLETLLNKLEPKAASATIAKLEPKARARRT
jgi:AcrR family transcriptional regulator